MYAKQAPSHPWRNFGYDEQVKRRVQGTVKLMSSETAAAAYDGATRAAAKALEQACESSPGVSSFVAYANYLAAVGEDARAEAIFEQALAKASSDENNANAALGAAFYATFLEERQHHDRAETVYQKAFNSWIWMIPS